MTAGGYDQDRARTAPKGVGAADLERVALEAGPALLGGRVRAVKPRGRGGILLAVRDARDERTEWFLARLDPPPLARAHLAASGRPARGVEEQADDVVPSASAAAEVRFCERLRALLEGAAVEGLAAVPGDRVLTLDASGKRLWLSFFGARGNAALEDLASGEVLASLREGEGRPLLTMPGPGARGERPPLFPEIAPDPATRAYSRALEAHFDALERAAEREERRRALLAEIEKRRKRAAATCRKLEVAVAECGRADESQRAGELLLASLRLDRRGASEVTVPDYFAEGAPCTIELDPKLAPAAQAERYFKQAKKFRRGIAIARKRLADFAAEAARLETAAARLAALPEDEDPSAVAAAAGVRLRGGAGRKSLRGKGPSEQAPSGPRRFKAVDGSAILVGRSNAENDELTIKTARSNDLFFHVQGFPGSHVIVKAAKGKSVPLETLLDAAALAVHYSKARDHGRVEISYTPRKYVRKPRGAPPGLVALERSETLLLKRAEIDARLARVLATGGRSGESEPEGSPRRPRTSPKTEE